MIDMPCPQCGKQIVKPLSALDANGILPCPHCGVELDFNEVKRGIEEAVKKAAFNITTEVKIKF